MEYELKLTQSELELIGASLNELPYKHVAVLFIKINAQVRAQDEKRAAELSLETPSEAR